VSLHVLQTLSEIKEKMFEEKRLNIRMLEKQNEIELKNELRNAGIFR